MLKDVAGQAVFTAEDGAGPPRLFIHCALGRHQALIPLAQALPPARNLFFDLPGHGQSAPWDGQNFHTDVFDIACDLLDAPTHVVGHSFGATVALRMAVERPDLVARVTLIEPVMFAAASDAARAAHRTAFAPFVEAWGGGDRDTAAAVFTGMWGTGPAWSQLPQKTREGIVAQIHMIPASASAIEEDVHGILPRLGEVTCPVDLIEGSNSKPIMAAILDGLQYDLPHAVRSCIPEAGHMVPITHPAEVAQAIIAA